MFCGAFPSCHHSKGLLLYKFSSPEFDRILIGEVCAGSARQWHYRTLCKISKEFDEWVVSYGQMSFTIYEFKLRPDIHTILQQPLVPFGHDDVITWQLFPRYWTFVRGIQRSPMNSPHKGQWHGALVFTFICAWMNGWVNNREAGNLRRHRDQYDVIVMVIVVAVLCRRHHCAFQYKFVWSCFIFQLYVPYATTMVSTSYHMTWISIPSSQHIAAWGPFTNMVQFKSQRG